MTHLPSRRGCKRYIVKNQFILLYLYYNWPIKPFLTPYDQVRFCHQVAERIRRWLSLGKAHYLSTGGSGQRFILGAFHFLTIGIHYFWVKEFISNFKIQIGLKKNFFRLPLKPVENFFTPPNSRQIWPFYFYRHCKYLETNLEVW